MGTYASCQRTMQKKPGAISARAYVKIGFRQDFQIALCYMSRRYESTEF